MLQVSLHDGLLVSFEVHLTFLQRSPLTRKTYRNAVKRFFAKFPTLELDLITPEHVEEYLASRPLSAASLRVERENLRAFFAWLHRKKGLIRSNPCDGVEVPKPPRKIRPAPTEEDVARLLTYCRDDQERLLVEGLYRTGLRISEFRSLRWEAIDFSRRRITVRGKGGHERVTFWRPGEIQAFEEPRQAGYLLAYRKGPWGLARIEQTLRRLGLQVGLPYRLTAHILRHGWFRAGKRRGLSLEVLARVGGHKHVSTTATMYSPMDVEDLQEVYGGRVE